jgi:hypothetical protein
MEVGPSAQGRPLFPPCFQRCDARWHAVARPGARLWCPGRGCGARCRWVHRGMDVGVHGWCACDARWHQVTFPGARARACVGVGGRVGDPRWAAPPSQTPHPPRAAAAQLVAAEQRLEASRPIEPRRQRLARRWLCLCESGTPGRAACRARRARRDGSRGPWAGTRHARGEPWRWCRLGLTLAARLPW